ncbi:chorismate-binding protein [Ottowia thiooxydans]|uniref:chorismate-binding protein n=1 Tax=Ottowia thiooxydans TaxID=219182 RepID=UPI00048CD946|nr:chorismate-binding protein [Ottowia thiooxydans]
MSFFPSVRAFIDFISPRAGEPPLRASFKSPIKVLEATELHQVREVIDTAHAYAKTGSWCVGFVCYEAAAAFDEAFVTHPLPSGPLAWFAVFDEAGSWEDTDNDQAVVEWHAPLKADDARAAIDDIHRRIAAGEVYQINHTARMRGTLRSGTPLALFSALQRAQPGTYAAFIDTGDQQVLSVSPELFFDWQPDEDGRGQILARPMKGTCGRGATPQEDEKNAAALSASLKERAENVMIVDLIRNDLSRIAELHSVKVPRLFHIEALPTVWSMTTDVVGCTRAGTTLTDVFSALCPCGSVTGAPKVQAMRTIRELEPDARGVYCGAIGIIRPGGATTFNVAIRTLELKGQEVRCGIGSGITIDAKFDGEWKEWHHKAAFVQRASSPFALLETLRIEGGVARHMDAHLDRMATSASHFGYPWDRSLAVRALSDLTAAHPQGVRRVRLLLHADGKLEVEAPAMADVEGPVQVQLASKPLAEAYGEFVRFKTTRRGHYDAFAPGPGVFDTLLWNEAGELTEFTRGNVAVKLDGRWLTPPLSSGLLPGVERAVAIASGKIEEGVVCVEDLARAESVAFFNSLRGWIPVQFVNE